MSCHVLSPIRWFVGIYENEIVLLNEIFGNFIREHRSELSFTNDIYKIDIQWRDNNALCYPQMLLA